MQKKIIIFLLLYSITLVCQEVKEAAKQVGKETLQDAKETGEEVGQDVKETAADVGAETKKLYDKAVVSPELKKDFGNLADKAKNLWHGAGGMLKGMGQGFGIVDSSYRYSYRVFNDASGPVFVAEERVTGFMGADFKGHITKDGGLTLGPNANSGNHFYDRQLYISVWICADKNENNIKKYARSADDWAKWGAIAGAVAGMGFASPLTTALGAALGALARSIATVETLNKYKIYERDIYPWPAKDDKIYFYRAYTYKGELKGEYLDLCGTTSAFSGQFYNRSKEDIVLDFSKDGKEYAVTLEPDTFNLLQSSKDIDYSIRPPQGDHTRGFQFYKGTKSDANKIAYIPVSPDGIANVTDPRPKEDQEKRPTQEADLINNGPKLYTYEIYDTSDGPEVGIQGLKIGHFDQPTSGKVRDINPAVCHLWLKDAKTAQSEQDEEQKKTGGQQQKDYSTVPYDIPEQVWISYETADNVVQEKVITGSVADFYLLRPQLKENEAWLYVVSLQTDDDTKAKKFLDRLHAGKIGQDSLFTNVTIEDIDKKTILTMTPNPHGFINDTEGADASGITGAVLLTDWFAPQGVGSGPFYYELDPGVLQIGQFVNCIWFDKKFYSKDPKTGVLTLSPDVMKELAEKLPQWIGQYQKNKDTAKAALKSYLQLKANEGLFVDASQPPAQREFTVQGKELYQTLIDGPISLEHYPIMRKTGMNWYIQGFGDKPDNWPKKS